LEGLLVEPHPLLFQEGLTKNRKANYINTCLSTLPRTTFMTYKYVGVLPSLHVLVLYSRQCSIFLASVGSVLFCLKES